MVIECEFVRLYCDGDAGWQAYTCFLPTCVLVCVFVFVGVPTSHDAILVQVVDKSVFESGFCLLCCR